MGSSTSCTNCSGEAEEPQQVQCSACPGSEEVSLGADEKAQRGTIPVTAQVPISLAQQEVPKSEKLDLFVRPLGAIPLQLGTLNGLWRNDKDDTVVGTVEEGLMVWDEDFQNGPTRLTLSANGENVEMELMGATYQGVYELGQPPRMRWSDGDVWYQVREESSSPPT